MLGTVGVMVANPQNEVRRFHANFSYRAGSWTKPRRVIAKVEWPSGRGGARFLEKSAFEPATFSLRKAPGGPAPAASRARRRVPFLGSKAGSGSFCKLVLD
jgi:hypothetical protein